MEKASTCVLLGPLEVPLAEGRDAHQELVMSRTGMAGLITTKSRFPESRSRLQRSGPKGAHTNGGVMREANLGATVISALVARQLSFIGQSRRAGDPLFRINLVLRFRCTPSQFKKKKEN